MVHKMHPYTFDIVSMIMKKCRDASCVLYDTYYPCLYTFLYYESLTTIPTCLFWDTCRPIIIIIRLLYSKIRS